MATPPEAASQEISYADAFTPQAANANAPPEVPLASGKQREIAYNDAFPPSAPPSILRQIVDPASAIDNALPSGSLYQSVKNIASAFGEGVKQTGDDIGKNLYSKDGGDLVSSLKSTGMFQPYVEDQNDFDKGFFYKTALPAIHNMIASASEAATRGAAIAGNVASLPLNAIGGALGQTVEELPQGGLKELGEYALNSPLLGETHLPVKEVAEDLASRLPPRVPRPVAEGEASGIVGTTEGQNSGVEPLTEDQHVRQAVAESEVNPVRAAEPITETPAPANDIHTNARILDKETFTQYDQLAATRDDLRTKLADNPDAPNADELKQQLQETNAGLRELAPKVSDAYLQAQQFEKQPESVRAEEMAGAPSIEPLEEQKEALAEKVSPIAAVITKKLVDIGQPAEQAQASGEVAARMYQYFADVYGGEKGTAQDWYEREGADIKGAKDRATVLAQPSKGGAELKQDAAAEPFYSALTRNIENLKQAKATGSEWSKIIDTMPATKKEEIDWSGVKDWLKGRSGKITKEQLSDYLKAHEVQLREVLKSSRETDEIRNRAKELSDKENGPNSWEKIGGGGQEHYIKDALSESGTKYGGYNTPGGKNYRELLMTLPHSTEEEITERKELAAKDREGQLNSSDQARFEELNKKSKDAFKTSHFDEPNILSHVRFNDRTGPNGEKILHLEEIQSDWHQKGRKQGYVDQEAVEKVKQLRDERSTLADKISAIHDEIGNHPPGKAGDLYSKADALIKERNALDDTIRQYDKARSGVPDAPFKTSWPELAFKRMIRYAAEHGYDKISWTTGEQQAARYDLSKQVKEISYNKESETIRVTDNDGKDIVKKMSLKDLPDFIGKEAAEKIEKGGNFTTLSGDGLKVGGEGMKGFYDKILPNIADKLGKKFGAKTEDTTINQFAPKDKFEQVPFGTSPEGDKVHALPITDGMRESAMQGQPLFQTTKGKVRLSTDDAKAVISLMKNADASTFVHESAHHFLDMMDRFSKEEDAPQKLKDDMASIRKWSGLSEKPYETPKEKKAYVAAQEKFARGFERYLMEGVAPNRDMALVFAKFKNWLTSIYRTVFSIPNQRGSINEDVRAFFDRVMSTNPERTVIAPNHPAELGLKANIESPRLGDLFGTVPKAPQTLTEWLAGKGGIKDDAGDLASMDADKAHIDLKTGKAKPFASKLVKADGLNLDDAARAAQEAGYFPEKGNERPSVEELKNKILEDLSGNKQYSDKDHEALNNHQDALKYNAQTEQIAHETGIDPTGKTHDQFFDEVNKYYQDEKRYDEAQEMAADTEKDYAYYEKREREFIETRGDAWEPPAEPEHATLEDLENERKQEQAAHDAASSAANAEGPQRAAGSGQPSEAGVRESGGSAEPDGRAGSGESETDAAEFAARQQLDAARANVADAPVGDTVGPETKPATRPNEPTGKSEFYDKAGNVRLDLLTDSDSIKAAMREAADKNPQIFNHGVITDAQVAEFADAMGTDAKNLNIQKLRQISVEDNIPLAARIRAGSKMMVDALNHALELMNKTNPTDEDTAKFLEAKNQFLMIAETVSATTNEMGRGFRAYNNLMKEYNVTDIQEAAELFQRMTGRTLDQVKAEMKAGSLLKTPKQVAKFTQDSLKPDFMDKLIEYRNNSLLSGPTTHTMYTIGGFLNAAYKPLQTLSGVGVQAVREALGSEINERMYAREALEQFHALSYGSMRGLKAAAESWKRNAEVALPGEIKSAPLLANVEESLKDVKGTGWLPRNKAISGKLGTAINVPSRVIGSIHSFLKVLGYEQNKAGYAVREAMDKGFDPKSDDYTKFVSDTIDNPTSKIMETAGQETLKGVYREKVNWNSTPGKLFNIVNSNPVTKVLFPFIKMQYNIKRLAFRDNSVLGFLDPSVRADVAGINGDVAKNMAIGKIAAGTAIAGLGVSMTMQGMNNGGGPSDPKAYKTWRLTHTPYSIQIGSIVIPHKALGTWGQLLGWSADMAEGAHEFDPANIEKSAWQFVRKAGAIFTEEGFLTQAKNTLDAAFTPQQFGTRFIQNFATQWLPFSTGFSQTNRLLNDPYARRVKSLGAENLWGIPESMEYKYPGTSELLQPMRDMFGQPITFASSYDKYANDRVVQKLESLNTGIGRLNDKIKGVQLTEQQYDDYSRISGQMTYARLSKMVGMPSFDKMPPQHQIQMIEKTTSECRLLAANQIMKMNPDIMTQARAKKKLSIYGNPAVNAAEENQTEDVNNP